MFRTLAKSNLLNKTVVSQQVSKRFGGGGAPGYEPGGYLFGEAPRPQGSKREWYVWEPIWWFGYCGTIAAWLVYHFAFNERMTLKEAATLEAQKRLAARGETFGWPLPPDYVKIDIRRGEQKEE